VVDHQLRAFLHLTQMLQRNGIANTVPDSGVTLLEVGKAVFGRLGLEEVVHRRSPAFNLRIAEPACRGLAISRRAKAARVRPELSSESSMEAAALKKSNQLQGPRLVLSSQG